MSTWTRMFYEVFQWQKYLASMTSIYIRYEISFRLLLFSPYPALLKLSIQSLHTFTRIIQMITSTNYMLLTSDINEMPQTIPNDLIGKDLIHEMTSDTHESIMKSAVLIPDNSLHNRTAFGKYYSMACWISKSKEKNEKENTVSIYTLFSRRCKMQVHLL